MSDPRTAAPTVANRDIWEQRYRRGEAQVRYPFEHVVGFVMRHFGRGDRAATGVLDFGCGIGNHLTFLVESGFSAFGTDAAEAAVLAARDRVRAVCSHYPVEDRIRVCNGVSLPFDTASFDAVVDRSSLGQATAGDIRLLVDEILRVLKPGGLYFGMNFSDLDPDLAFASPMGGGDFHEFSQGKFKGIGSRHFFSPTEIRTLFAGFTIVDIRLLDERSLMGKGSSVQIIVSAMKQPGT